MKTLLRLFLFAFFTGIGIGWILAETQRRREEQVAHDAFVNDPELVAIRKERALDRQLFELMPDVLMGDDDDEPLS